MYSTVVTWKSGCDCYCFTISMHKVVLEVKDDSELLDVSTILETNHIDHYLWKEQPENVVTALATKPYVKSAYGTLLRHLRLLM